MPADDRSGMSVLITSRDMQATLRFYVEQCGFEMKESWPSDEAPQWANLVLGGQSVMVGEPAKPEMVERMCADDPVAKARWTGVIADWNANKPGVGLQVYVQVPDIDAFAARLRERGASVPGEPKSQFYGIRELPVTDPDGYQLMFFTPITMSSCQSCGMPLQDAQPGDMHCDHCTDESGHLRPYEHILEGTVTGYFMGMQKMERGPAEAAAREHLSKMPAWASCQ